MKIVGRHASISKLRELMPKHIPCSHANWNLFDSILDYMESNLPEYSQKGLPSIGDCFSYEDLDYGFVNVPGYKSKTALGSGADMMPIEKINPLTGDRFSYNPTKGIWEFTAHSKKRKFLPNVFGEWK